MATDQSAAAAVPAARPAIRLEHVSKRFPGAASDAVSNLSLELPAGEITVLVGPSGCGKTTTLKMINRLEEPTAGHIEIFGEDQAALPPHELRRQIGYVIQDVGLFPHRTIAENIGTVPHLLGWPKGRIRDRVAELAELVRLEPDQLDRYPAALSGGQRQRAGVARALAADPPILLMDEPFGAVDPVVRARLQEELLALQQRLHKTIVFVTHDIEEATRLGDRVAVLDVGGVLAQYAPPAEMLRQPANAFVEEFLGAERGLRELSLFTVADAPLDRTCELPPSATCEDARAAMDLAGASWALVVDGGRCLGWLDRSHLVAALPSVGAAATPLRRWVTPAHTLREALEVALTSHTRVAIVLDGERYAGVLPIERIAQRLED
ncbi:MAG: ATP-binding cassette domain-containing protein [Dehalococcoidia bacterium]